VALTTTTTEVLETQARLWCHTYGYLKSMALHSAIKLGVPNAMSRRRGAASLTELHADLPIARSKRPCLSRLMRFLAAIGIFSEAEEDTAATAATGDQRRYRLIAASRLLVHDDGGDTRLSPFLTVCATVLFRGPPTPTRMAGGRGPSGDAVQDVARHRHLERGRP
jgi:trans-resveratrol di-O-methyltransferase